MLVPEDLCMFIRLILILILTPILPLVIMPLTEPLIPSRQAR